MILRHRNLVQRFSDKSFGQQTSYKFTKLCTDETEQIQPWKGAKEEEEFFYDTPGSQSQAILQLTSRSKQPELSKRSKQIDRPEPRRKTVKTQKKQPSSSNHRRHRSENNLKFLKKQPVSDLKKTRLTASTTTPFMVNMALQRISLNCREQSIKPVNFFKLTFSPKKYPKSIIRKDESCIQQNDMNHYRQKMKLEPPKQGSQTVKYFNVNTKQVEHPKLALQKLRKTFLELKIDRLAPNPDRRLRIQ